MEEYTIKQAAEVLEVSTSTVRRRIKSGELAAEKRKTSYGQQYFIPKKELDRAITDKDVVDIQEVSRPISQEELKNTLIEAVEGKNKALFKGIVDKIDKQQQTIDDYKEQLEQQNELMKDIKEELKDIKKKQNKSFIDKVKDFFK